MLGIGRSLLQGRAKKVFFNKYSLLLDGSDQAVQIDGLANNFKKGTGTISAWVRPNSVDASSTWVHVAVDANNFYRIWWHHSSTLIKGQIKSGGNNDLVQFEDTDFASSTDWYHVVMTWDTTADEMKLYVDNSLKETDGIDNSGDFSGSFAVADIGKNGQADNAYWKGYIDEVSIFDQTLTAAQVSTLYNGGNPSEVEFSEFEDGLIGYYIFSEGSGTTTADESETGGNDGTLENAPSWSKIVP